MTKERLLAILNDIADREGSDPEAEHAEAEQALLEYIDDPDIIAAWHDAAQFFWYA